MASDGAIPQPPTFGAQKKKNRGAGPRFFVLLPERQPLVVVFLISFSSDHSSSPLRMFQSCRLNL